MPGDRLSCDLLLVPGGHTMGNSSTQNVATKMGLTPVSKAMWGGAQSIRKVVKTYDLIQRSFMTRN